jgi:hypothetical protein
MLILAVAVSEQRGRKKTLPYLQQYFAGKLSRKIGREEVPGGGSTQSKIMNGSLPMNIHYFWLRNYGQGQIHLFFLPPC